MNGYQHLIGGAAAGADLFLLSKKLPDMPEFLPSFVTDAALRVAGYFAPSGVLQGVLCTGLFFLGCLFPDTDSPYSLIGRHVRIAGGGHRKWMHTVYPVLLCFLFGIKSPHLLWFGLGYLIHLFLDAPSKCGVCFFNPVTGYRKYPGDAKIKKNHVVVLYRSEAGAWILLLILYLISGIFLWQNRMFLFG